jgi:hypothetical protein
MGDAWYLSHDVADEPVEKQLVATSEMIDCEDKKKKGEVNYALSWKVVSEMWRSEARWKWRYFESSDTEAPNATRPAKGTILDHAIIQPEGKAGRMAGQSRGTRPCYEARTDPVTAQDSSPKIMSTRPRIVFPNSFSSYRPPPTFESCVSIIVIPKCTTSCAVM